MIIQGVYPQCNTYIIIQENFIQLMAQYMFPMMDGLIAI